MINVKDGDRILFIGDSITDVDFNEKENETIGGKNIYALQMSEKLKQKHKNLTSVMLSPMKRILSPSFTLIIFNYRL